VTGAEVWICGWVSVRHEELLETHEAWLVAREVMVRTRGWRELPAERPTCPPSAVNSGRLDSLDADNAAGYVRHEAAVARRGELNDLAGYCI
jgi:hypothetical protein